MSKIQQAIQKAQAQSTHKRAPFATTAPDPLEILLTACPECGHEFEAEFDLPDDSPDQLELLDVPMFLRRQAE